MPKKKISYHREETKAGAFIDALEAHEQFKRDVLPKLRRALKEGVTPEKLYEQFSDLAAARTITIALTEEDSGKALAAIKEIQDRAYGKPKERVEQTHKYSKLKDEELDALVESKLRDAGYEVDTDEEDDSVQRPN